jgi:hypothetical protein
VGVVLPPLFALLPPPPPQPHTNALAKTKAVNISVLICT